MSSKEIEKILDEVFRKVFMLLGTSPVPPEYFSEHLVQDLFYFFTAHF